MTFSSDHSEERNPAERALAEFLRLLETDEAPDFEAFCAQSPEIADELRSLYAKLCALSGELRGRPQPASLTDRMKQLHGPDVNPEITLDAPPSDMEAESPSELLKRLGAHTAPQTRYRLKGEVARGGMGVILKAWDEDLRRNLAMKVILGKGEGDASGATPVVDPAKLSRFLEEAQVTGQLEHPGIVPVHELGLDAKGRVYFTMRLVKGRPLHEIFDMVKGGEDDWSVTRALSVILDICEAMAFAHDKGVIHRDLKPANVMVGKYGETYVMDWGLARVLGRPDQHDIRPQEAEPPKTSEVMTDRHDETPDRADSPLLTRDGTALGTPAYMPPEQALGMLEEVGPAADVYALGAILYHLLTGAAPYAEAGARLSPHTILAMVIQGPPRPVHALNPEIPAALEAICEKAMARRIPDRYPSMEALAADLRALLEDRVVAAYESGPIAELKKWVVRNKAVTATVAAAAVVLAAVLWWSFASIQGERDLAEASERLAKTKEQEARSSEELARDQKNQATARKAEFDQLAGVVLLKEALAAEKELYPAWPGKIDAMTAWLADAAELMALKPTLATTLSDLEARALPWTDEDREQDRVMHPRYPELEPLALRVASLRAAQALRDGKEHVPAASLPAELLLANARSLNEYARRRLDWDLDNWIFGEEREALQAARSALKRIESGDDSLKKRVLLDTLAWAMFANGLDEEAVEVSSQALDLAPMEKKPEYEWYRKKLEEAVSAAGQGALSALESELASLEAELSVRRTWRFETSSQRFLYNTLWDLSRQIGSFERNEKSSVALRLSWARRVDELTRNHPNALFTWEEARESIQVADGVLASDLYRDPPIDLKPQMGLVPIGMNPMTLLWEFYDLRTAFDLDSGKDPSDISIPEHSEDGTLAIGDETGLVFVLIPGGMFWMGAQPTDPAGRNYDPQARSDESPVQEVTLAAYFLSRYEMTQGQWKRISGDNPSNYGPEGSWRWGRQWDTERPDADFTHPVEHVSWEDCIFQLGRVGLLLPTEAQWESACRARTETPWWTGSELLDLDAAGNLSDQYGKTHGAGHWSSWEAGLDDGNTVHASVGRYGANRFGLHDTIGNVWEWCLDGYGGYGAPGRAGDGLRSLQGASNRVVRGGSFESLAVNARSGNRGSNMLGIRNNNLGCRPARDLEP